VTSRHRLLLLLLLLLLHPSHHKQLPEDRGLQSESSGGTNACTLLLQTIELVSRAAAARSHIHIIMDRIISRDNVGSPERQWGSSRLATVLLLGVCNLICYAGAVLVFLGVSMQPAATRRFPRITACS
jgi:hypothetical protein